MERISRDEVKRRLVGVCKEITALVAGSYGPLGRAQLLQANAQCPDALTLTSVAERYFANLKYVNISTWVRSLVANGYTSSGWRSRANRSDVALCSIGDCPIANAYYHILKSKIRSHTDAGLFLAGLSASLQFEVQEGRLAEIPHCVVSRGLQLVLDWCLEYLEDPRCPVRTAVNWSSTTSISAVTRGIIAPKTITGLDDVTMDTVLIPLIIQAFVSVFGYVVEHPSEAVPVRLLFAPGQNSIAKSECWKQTLLLDLPWPSRGRRHGDKRNLLSPPICDVRVALFNITIEPLVEFEEENASSGTSLKHSGSLSAFRLKALRQVGDRLEHLGATAVLSQKIIPKYLQTYLAAKGIFTLDRLSATYIRGVQVLSGATILSDWRIDDGIVSSSLGYLSLITTQTLGSKQYIRLHQEDSSHQSSFTTKAGTPHLVTTLAIAAPDRFAYDELSHLITTSLKTLASLINNPDVVAGAGCLEIHLAAVLRRRASHLRTPALTTSNGASKSTKSATQAARTLRQVSQIVTAFADCLENLVGRLCGSQAAASDRDSMIEHVCAANSKSLSASDDADLPQQNMNHKLFGWDPRKRSVMPVLSYTFHEEEPGSDIEKIITDARILDVLQSKKDALVLAIESVSSLARISSVVHIP